MMINLMEYSSNLEYKHSDPLMISAPGASAMKTHFMPRGTPQYRREYKSITDNDYIISGWVREYTIYDINIVYPEPMKALCLPA